MLEGLAGAVDDVALGIESDRCLLDPQFELRALIGYVDMFTCETSFPYSAQRSKWTSWRAGVRVQKYYKIVRLP